MAQIASISRANVFLAALSSRHNMAAKMRFPGASASCFQFVEAFFRRYSHSTHIDTEIIAHQSFLKYLGGISRSVDSFHFV